MKKVFINDKLEGKAINIKKSEKELVFTFSGDFPGMAEKNVVLLNGKILYEDEKRIYVKM